MDAGLATVGDALVKRRKTNGGKSVKQKHASDIWQLVCSLKNKTSIPRTLLRNGKRSKDGLMASQARHQVALEQTNADRSHSALEQTNADQSHSALESSRGSEPETSMITNETNDGATTAFQSTVVSDISSLKASIDSLKEDIQALKGKLNKEPTAVDDCDTCLIYMRLKHPTTEILNEGLLESKLSTTIWAMTLSESHPLQPLGLRSLKFTSTMLSCMLAQTIVWQTSGVVHCNHFVTSLQDYLQQSTPLQQQHSSPLESQAGTVEA